MTKTPAVRKPRPALADAPLAVMAVPIGSVRPAAVNDEIYKHVRADDPSVVALAESVRAHGVLDPLIVTADGVILSGHRRHAAARLAGLTAVPVIYRQDIHSADPDFVAKLVEDNRAFWPLTLRQCHYRMLNTGVLRHAKKPGSKYVNDDCSYKDLGDLLVG